MAYKVKKYPIRSVPKAQLAFWIIVRIAMLGCAAYSFIVDHDVIMGFESVFCFIFTHLWDMFQVFGNGSFIEEVTPLSQTMLNLIIFIGIVFGSYAGFFDTVPHFDDFMHALSGFVCASFGYDFAVILQRKKGPCSVILAAMFGIMFAMTIACGWEMYEFIMDRLYGTNLQLAKPIPGFDYAAAGYQDAGDYGLIDTMTDISMNAIGGIAGMIFMIVYRKKTGKKAAGKLAETEKAPDRP